MKQNEINTRDLSIADCERYHIIKRIQSSLFDKIDELHNTSHYPRRVTINKEIDELQLAYTTFLM